MIKTIRQLENELAIICTVAMCFGLYMITIGQIIFGIVLVSIPVLAIVLMLTLLKKKK